MSNKDADFTTWIERERAAALAADPTKRADGAAVRGGRSLRCSIPIVWLYRWAQTRAQGRQFMKTRYTVALSVLAGVMIAIGSPALAQSLKDKVVGAWTLVSGSENYPDGKKLTPWETGNLILDPTGHVSFFVIAKDRPKSSSVRTPVGPMVAYYGTSTIDEPNATLTYKIERAASPSFEGAIRTQKVSFKGDVMVMTGSEVETPEGKMIPINEWKKAK
jgi:hypothetical protein